ncbi:MAG: hypothetical protein NTX92_09345 [Euryarchaeota archaeon]|nr:hypothetical protein [Euryarchaeota archaeon]
MDVNETQNATQKVDVAQRRIELKKLIEEKGLHSLNKKELGRQYGVSDTMISNDIEMIMGDLPPVDWIKLFNKTLMDIDRSLEIANKALDNTTDAAAKGRLASQISEILLKKTSILEKMEKLLPSSAKAEPVTVVYRSVDALTVEKAKEQVKEPEDDLGSVLSSG